MTALWQKATLAPDGTHHLADGEQLYSARFAEVLTFHAPGLAPVRDSSGAYHIDPSGTPAYARRFRRTFGFYEGRAAVEDESGAHHIDVRGQDVGSRQFAWCGNFQGGRCTVRDAGDRYFHVGEDDEPAYAERWRYAGDFREGAASVQVDTGMHHHIDVNGRRINGRDFIDLDVFHKGFARARDATGWFHVRRDGRPAYDPRFAAIEPFYNGQARCERFDESLIVIDEAGRELLRLREPRRSPFAALSGDMVGFWKTQTLAAGVELGVFDALPGAAEEISTRVSIPHTSVERLLRALGELGAVELAGSHWLATEKGNFLRSDSSRSLGHAAIEYAGVMSARWENLTEALRRGDAWAPPDFFAGIASIPELRDAHHRTLAAYARHDYAPLADAIDGGRHELLIDAGGGHGVLVTMLLERHSRLRAVLLDRPEVLEHAALAASIGGRVKKVVADFFEPWPERADAIVLARVLHDWNDDAALRLLRHARTSLMPAGRLYVAEMLLDESGYAGGLCDLHLLVVTGGRERTHAQYRQLLEDAGFALIERQPLASIVSLLIAEAR
jgi:SAM-dependent methyltransferase